jgi:diguanylate cyclase
MRHERPFVNVAREALRRLSRDSLAPTPRNYEAAWREVTGEPPYAACSAPDDCETCATLASMLRLTADCVSGTALQGGWVQSEIARLKNQLVPPWEARRFKALEGPLAEALGAETAMRSELANAKAGIKEILATLIGRIGNLSESTGEFSEKVDRYAREIEQADGIEALARLTEGLAQDTRQMKGNLEQTRRELISAQERAQSQEARVRDLEHELEKAREQVRTDSLTGALNRRGFEQAWEREAARTDRSATPLSLSVIDLDNFKNVNDTYGHAIGDRALVHLVAVAREVVRPTDLVARLGGEEFALVLPGAGPEEALAITQRLQRALTRELFLGDDKHLFITFSAGVASRRGDETWEQVLKRADQALYEAKRSGKNLVVMASEPDRIAA